MKKKYLIPCNVIVPQFKYSLDLAVKESFFIFNNCLYKQSDGVAMGSPLGPTLANIFLCYYESLWLDECPPIFKPIYYRRYVDDCFLLFRDKEHASLFLNYLNTRHKNITFTIEHEVDQCLPFLDVLVHKENNKLYTNVYRKQTYTGLGLNYFSYVPQLFKLNAIKTLVFRAYNICCSWQYFHQERET